MLKSNNLKTDAKATTLESRAMLAVPFRPGADARFTSSPFVEPPADGSTTANQPTNNVFLGGQWKLPKNWTDGDKDRAKALALDAMAWWDTLLDGDNRLKPEIRVNYIDGPGGTLARAPKQLKGYVEADSTDLQRRSYNNSFITFRHEMFHNLGFDHGSDFNPLDGRGKLSKNAVETLEKAGWQVNTGATLEELQTTYSNRYNELLDLYNLSDSPHITKGIAPVETAEASAPEASAAETSTPQASDPQTNA